MDEYQKIQTVYHRNPADNYKTLLEGQWSKPEFELLKDVQWVWTEKIDGTNIRVIWDGHQVSFAGKTDRAKIPRFLLARLQKLFTPSGMRPVFGETPACLYGEGYGEKIQRGGYYCQDRTDFILFDCKIEGWWLERPNLEDIAQKLKIDIVPVVGAGSLSAAIELVRTGFDSLIAETAGSPAEGLVVKPKVELFNRKGERVISKIKHKDFRA